MDYTFVLKRTKNKLQKVQAPDFAVALDKVLALNPNTFVSTKFARNLDGLRYVKRGTGEIVAIIATPKLKPFKLIINTMDLVSAKVEAAKQSKEQRKKMYINLDDEGECIVTSTPAKNIDDIAAAFVNGSEVKELSEVVDLPLNKSEKLNTSQSKQKSKTKMATTATKKAAPAKKAAAPVKKSSTPKSSLTGRATTLLFTDAEWAKLDKMDGSIREMAAEGIRAKYLK